MGTTARVHVRNATAAGRLGATSRPWSVRFACACVVALVGSGPLAAPARGQGFTTLAAPIQVPLSWTPVGNGNKDKLGIYATLGGGATPQLFEFDTGAAGFFATYGSGTASPWWGDAWTPASTGTFTQEYDSGNVYTGTTVTTAVSLFASPTSTLPLLTATSVLVGQTQSLTNGGSVLWPSPPAPPTPPLEGVFYGDFGMAPEPGVSGIDALAAQLRYGPGVTPGFRVHASPTAPWVQFGLTAADTGLGPLSFALNVATGSSPAGVPYYDMLVVTGSLAVSSGTLPPFAQPTGFIFDTGAVTTIHNVTSTAPFPAAFISANGMKVIDGAGVLVTGSSLLPGGGWPVILSGTTAPGSEVKVQTTGTYYLNTGIAPFEQYDVVYDLGGAVLSLVPVSGSVPEIGAAGLGGAVALVAGTFGLLERRRRIAARPHHRLPPRDVPSRPAAAA